MVTENFYILNDRLVPPETGYVAGEVKLRATARYGGMEVVGESASFLLQ